jgi:hypothetical protein
MKNLFFTIILACLVPSISFGEAKKMSRRDREYKQKHLKDFGRKKGYQGNKDWSNFIEMAVKYEDKEILKKMLTISPKNRVELTEYITDLFKVHKAKPEFFVSTSYDFYKSNMDCVVRLFKTKPELLKPKELNEANKVKKPSKIFKKYLSTFNQTDLYSEKGKEATKTYVKCQKIKEGLVAVKKVKKKSKK